MMSTSSGQQLRQAREGRKLTLEQAAKATHIRVHYLKAMEADDFDSLPSATQARGFLRIYASYLDLDADVLLSYNQSGQEPPKTIPAPPAAQLSEPGKQIFRQADEIFISIGNQLRNQRELLGVSLVEVERHTHLRQHYLLALESGDLDALPSPVQGRGMLNNYATFLGMDADTLLLRFAEGLQLRLSARQAEVPPKEKQESRKTPALPGPLRRLFSGDVLIGGGIIAVLVIFVLWGTIRVFSYQSDQVPTGTAPSIADILLASATPTLTETPLPPTATPLGIPQLFPTPVVATDEQTGEVLSGAEQGTVQVTLSVRQRAWLRVLVDNDIEYEGRILPGSAFTFSGDQQIEILVSSGSAVQVFFNQQDLGTPGLYGQVVNLIYSQAGVLAPTPTVTPTLLATPTGTAVPVPTQTPAGAPATVPALP